MKISFFSPKTQFENIGDVLINRELISLMSNNSDVVVDLSRSPEGFGREVDTGSENVRLKSYGFIFFIFYILYTKLILRKDCYFYLSPGGYFGELGFIAFLKQLLNNVLLLLFKILGVKIIAMGVSYERLGIFYKVILKFRSLLLSKHYVRDQVSLNYIRSLGFKCNGVLPDLAFNIKEDDKKQPRLNKNALFSFRVDQCPIQKKLVKKLIMHLHQTVDSSIDFVFYAQVERDIDYMKELFSEIRLLDFNSNRQCQFINQDKSIKNALDTLSKSDLVLSNRLHVLLFAISVNSKVLPFIYKGYNEKIIGLFSDLGLESKVNNLESFESINIDENVITSKSSEFSQKNKELREKFSSIYC